jgi:hypothetical protein
LNCWCFASDDFSHSLLDIAAVVGSIEPVQRATPCLLGGVRVEARSRVIEEGVIGQAEREQLILQSFRIERRFRRGPGGIKA